MIGLIESEFDQFANFSGKGMIEIEIILCFVKYIEQEIISLLMSVYE